MLTTEFTDPDVRNVALPDSLHNPEPAFVILLLHPLFSAEILRSRITLYEWLIMGFVA